MSPRSERSRRYQVYVVVQPHWGIARRTMAGSFDSVDEAIRCARSFPDAETFVKDRTAGGWGSGYLVNVRTGDPRWGGAVGWGGIRQAGRFNSLSIAIRYAEALPSNDVYIRDLAPEDPVTVWEKLHYLAWAKQRYAIWPRRGQWERKARFKDLQDAIIWANSQGMAACVTDENQPGRLRVWEKKDAAKG